jgi:hypothetical protein
MRWPLLCPTCARAWRGLCSQRATSPRKGLARARRWPDAHPAARLGWLLRWRIDHRCGAVPWWSNPMGVPRASRKTCGVRTPIMPPRRRGRCRRSCRSQHTHQLAVCRQRRPSVLADALPCGRANMQTKRRAARWSRRGSHRVPREPLIYSLSENRAP